MKRLASDRHKSGLWAALFIILLLPFLFLRQGGGSLSLLAPALNLSSAVPRATVLWDYQGGRDEVPLWLGGPLLGAVSKDAGNAATLVALGLDGGVLFREEFAGGFQVVTNGQAALLRAESGRVTLLGKSGAPLWADPSDWPVQTLALAPDGRAAVVQGPLTEGAGNLIERVRFYHKDGRVAGEYLLRNASALKVIPSEEDWLLSIVGLGTGVTKARLIRFTASTARAEELWRAPELIRTLAVSASAVAAASGQTVRLLWADGRSRDIEFVNPVSHLFWTAAGQLVMAESGASSAAPGRVTLLVPTGKKLWQRRLRGPCRGLLVRADEVLVADTHQVYALDLAGRLKWCYQSSLPLESLAPLAGRNEVILHAEGDRLLLIQPPPATSRE